MSEAVRCAQSMAERQQIKLAVTAGNDAAVAAYESFGFKAYGAAPEALQVGGNFYDEIQMVRHLGVA